MRRLWTHLQGSFWFVPSLIVLACLALAIGLVDADTSSLQPWLARWPRIFGAGPEGARQMLSTIAGSMMTIVGVTFSMTLMTLALASSQYTSRVLRNFMRDRTTQVVLGTFAGIFTYCLVVLRTIRGGGDTFVPSLAVSTGVVLAIGGIAALIVFIHHIASAIQASSIIAAVGRETVAAVDRLFPQALGQPSTEPVDPAPPPGLAARRWHPIPAAATGYLQSVDTGALLRLATTRGATIRVDRAIGEFCIEGHPLAAVDRPEGVDEKFVAALRGVFDISRFRTLEQDAAFGIRQLVDIALRALSPGTNDTTTAIMCVDHLAAIVARLAAREIPSPFRRDGGALRVIVRRPDFAAFVATAFAQIRESSTGNVAIQLHLLGALHIVAGQIDRPERRAPLRTQLRGLVETARRSIACSQDRTRLAQRIRDVRRALAS